MRLKSVSIVFALASLVAAAPAQIRITEWMYNGASGTTSSEFVEITNVGTTAVDLTGWLFSDDHRDPSTGTSLSGLGILAAGQSGLLTEASAADFRALWGLGTATAIVGGNLNNLGRADEMNLYNAGGTLVDRLTYNDQTPLGPRTNGVSGNVPRAALGLNDATRAVLSTAGDAYGSRTVSGLIANPGVYAAPVPEPTGLAVLGLASFGWLRRRAAK